jgi:hypothetical protein
MKLDTQATKIAKYFGIDNEKVAIMKMTKIENSASMFIF